jgi:hypothetical protein
VMKYQTVNDRTKLKTKQKKTTERKTE